MRFQVLTVVAAAAITLAQLGCSNCPVTDSRCNSGVGGSGGSGGAGGGGEMLWYDVYTLDNSFSDRFYMEIAVDSKKNRVGVTYVAGQGEIPIVYLPGDAGVALDPDAGQLDAGIYALKYVEWEEGQAKTPERVDVVQRMVGLAIDFHPTTGEPAIGYLGGNSDNSLYWFNSDAALSYRAGGTWTRDLPATNGAQVTCGNPVSDLGPGPGGVVVGLWPAIKYDSLGTLWYCYRDVHTGQYPQGDWAGSDVECVHGRPGNWTRECTYAGGNNKSAPGGRIRMTMVDDQPTIIWDQAYGGADTSGQNINLQSRTSTGWGANTFQGIFTLANTQAGGTLDYDSMEGIGVAALDLTMGVLNYTNKTPGASRFSTADKVFGEGTGGWFPSLAMDKVNHEPAIAFYVCSDRPNQNASQCKPSFDEVRVMHRIGGNWHTETVDRSSATMVKFAFLPDGRKVVVFRESNGTVKLAVRKSVQ